MKTLVKAEEGKLNLYQDNKLVGECTLIEKYQSYKLPENDSGRQWVTVTKFQKCSVDGVLELTPHTERIITTSGKKLEDYLTDEEKATIAAIMANAKARKEANKPSDKEKEILKAQKQIEKYTKMLNDLKGNN